MHEIEVKARVQDVVTLKNILVTKGIHLNDPSLQCDTIYIAGPWEQVKNDLDRIIMRIREQTGRAVLTLKKNGSNELHSIEHETPITHPKEMHGMLVLMGYQPFIEVKKKRQKAKVDDIELCLDEVEGLGWFIEAERLLEDGGEAEKVQEELFIFLEEFGISKEDQETNGYDTLMRIKRESGQ